MITSFSSKSRVAALLRVLLAVMTLLVIGGARRAQAGDLTTAILGTVYFDVAGNGQIDQQDTGVPGVTVTLYNQNHVQMAPPTTTDDGGTYLFFNVTPGTYYVELTVPTGFIATNAIPNGPNSGGTKVSTTSIRVNVATALTTYMSEDFLIAKPVSIAGSVYDDVNGNGAVDAGEGTIPGVTVTLLDMGGNQVASQATDAGGAYQFTKLAPGAYTVVETLPSGYVATNAISGPQGGGTKIDNTTLNVAATSPGGVYAPNDFLLFRRAAIHGSVYCDANGNRSRDTGENGIAGVTVTLCDSTGAALGSAVTDAGGAYVFTGLAPGSYVVKAPAVAGGESLETDAVLAVPVPAGPSDASPDFGYVGGAISGLAYQDVNTNGQYDSGEPLLDGVSVTLTDSTGAVVATTTTDSSGAYAFSGCGIVAGSYTVTAPGTAKGLSLETPGALAVAITPGGTSGGNNFGYIANASIKGTAYCDANRSKSRDGGESGIAGATITLTDGSGGVVKQVTTDSSGAFAFTGLGAGSYTLAAAGVAAGKLLDTSASLTATVGAGQSSGGNDFGYIGGSISGTTYWDKNADRSFGVGDAPLASVTVTLKDSAGNVVGTTTTAANGSYLFAGCDLGAGVYTISAPSTAGGLNIETPSPLAVTLAPGADSTGNDFGYVATGTISGTAYCDANANGSRDSAESGIGGAIITLVDSTGKTVGQVTTDGTGAYTFSGLAAGAYTVTASTVAGGKALETSATLTASVAAGQNVSGLDFGYVGGSISGYVYWDLDDDGAFNCYELGLPFVTVTLTGTNGAVIATTTTECDGSYTFDGCELVAGAYKVSVPKCAWFMQVQTTNPLAVTLGPGENVTKRNFGYDLPECNGGKDPCQPYTTATQGGWGAKPCGKNPAALLSSNFCKLYSCGVVIGGCNTLKFTSAAAIEAFLPQSGTPAVLTKSAVNPTGKWTVLAGQTLALQLNVDFSKAGIWRSGLSSLKVVSGPLQGKTVAQVLSLANTVLGGKTSALPSGVSLSDLNNVLDAINQDFDGGTTNNGYLK